MTDLSSSSHGPKDVAPEYLSAVLTSLPDDLPPELKAVFGTGFLAEGNSLPPRLYQEAVEHMSVAISITDRAATILYVNPAFEKLTGYEATEIIGKNESILSNKRTPAEVYADLWQTISRGGTWHGRLINRRASGERYLAELTIVPVATKAGEVRYFLGMHRDITEMNHLQREVENQKNLIEGIIDSAPVVMALVHTDGDVILANRAYKSLAVEMAGQEPADFFIKAMREMLGGDLVAACAEAHTLSGVEVRFNSGSGKFPRWFACSAQWVREFELAAETYFETERQNALLIVCNEITHLKRQYEQLRFSAVRAQMAELEMRRNVREVIDGALYQLQGPLNVVQAMASLRQRRDDDNDHVGPALDEALSSGRAAIEKLRLTQPPLAREFQSPVNINQVIRDVLVSAADRLSSNGIVVDWRPESGLPMVYGQDTPLRVLLKILVDNAITAIGEPGARGRELRVQTRLTSDGMIELCVHDSGPGIDKASRSRIFEPFYSRWLRAKPGIGMGLAIARQIVGEFGGDLFVDPHHLPGCAVCVMLPACRTLQDAECR